MTDGQGNTVYFSESIIIFTSNLGIYTIDEFGNKHSNVNSDMPYDEVKTRVRTAVEDYFKLQLGRPEISWTIFRSILSQLTAICLSSSAAEQVPADICSCSRGFMKRMDSFLRG